MQAFWHLISREVRNVPALVTLMKQEANLRACNNLYLPHVLLLSGAFIS